MELVSLGKIIEQDESGLIRRSASFLDEMISNTIEKLYSGKLYDLKYKANYELPTPSTDALSKSISLLRAVIFPGYFEIKVTDKTDMRNRIQKTLNEASKILLEQIYRVLCFEYLPDIGCAECKEKA